MDSSSAAAATEAALLSNLQSFTTDLTDIHHQFSSYLHPFTAMRNPKTTKKLSKTTKPPDAAAIRSLAKQYISFLNKALSLLPKRLSKTSGHDEVSKEIALELFDAYKLCLDCLDLIASQLSSKPYSVHIQRARYLHCLEAWELYKEAENEGFSVLESLRAIDGSGTGTRAAKGKMRYVPKLNQKSVDQDLALLVTEIVVKLVKCASGSLSKNGDEYQRIIVLINEAGPWFRALGADAGEKMQRLLVTYLSRIAVYLVTEMKYFGGELAYKFCSITFVEHQNSSLKDQMCKFARRICSYLFSQEDDQSSNIIGTLKLVLDTMANECQVGVEDMVVDYLELVSYCANKCCSRSRSVCDDVTEHLRKLSGNLCEAKGNVSQGLSFTGSVMRMYAAGISCATACCSSIDYKFSPQQNAEGSSALRFLIEKEDIFLMLSDSLNFLKCYLDTSRAAKNLPQRENPLAPPFIDALEFLCQLLAKVIDCSSKEILAETEDHPICTILDIIQNAFFQFCSIYLQHHSAAGRVKDSFDDNGKIILRVAVAALTISFSTKRGIKESMNFLEKIILASWIQVKGLQYLFASLYNNAVILFRAKRMQEASRALEIACKASWECVILICRILGQKASESENGLSEDAAVSLCNEACAKAALLLDFLSQNSHLEVERVLKDHLESWSVAKSLLLKLPSPVPLLKQWVKIQLDHLKDVDMDVDVDPGARTLYPLLSTSAKVSKWTLTILMEQELVLYQEMNARTPIICQNMRMKIIHVLLENLYASKDSPLERSRILIKKGRELRANGKKDIAECIRNLSEAITTLSDIRDDMFSCEANGLLAYAYCLRELCTQEEEPNTKQRFQDFHTGVGLCLRPRCCHAADHCHTISGDLLNTLNHVFDFLSIKGYMDLHFDIYRIMIQSFEWKKLPLGKLLAVLWKSRRLSHPLCPSPIDTSFITEFSKNHDELSRLYYWVKSMEESMPVLVGFEPSFVFMLAASLGFSYVQDSVKDSKSMDEKINEAVSDLVSGVPSSSESSFLSAYLYHDLSERLILRGQVVEALFYAKEAQRLRCKLLLGKFVYSVENPDEISNEHEACIKKGHYKLKTFEVNSSAATAAWVSDGSSCDIEDCILTPWNVLQCYLESTLQVGIIHELLGNLSEAETLLWWGKSISCFKSLTIFGVSFSTILGKVYRKQHHWDLAEKELQRAMELFHESSSSLSCLRCKSILEVSIIEQLGDLHRSCSYNGAESPSIERLSYALDMYRSVLSKLNIDTWEKLDHHSGAATTELIKEIGNSLPNDQVTYQQEVNEFPSKGGRRKIEKVIKRPTEAKTERKAFKQIDDNLRRTRSRSRHCQSNSGTLPNGISTDLAVESNSTEPVCCQAPHSSLDLETVCSVSDLFSEITCLCNKIKCLHCHLLDIHSSDLLSKHVCLRWELVRRRLLLRSLIGIGKCLSLSGYIHEAREVLVQSMSLLVNRKDCPRYSSSQVTILLDLIGEDEQGNMIIIESASLLYHICWISLKGCPCKSTRQLCSELAHIGQSKIIYWLRMVFILCREVPPIFQKVSRLLAALYVLSTTVKPFRLFGKTLSESHWASFFHQASLGTHNSQELISKMTPKQKCVGLEKPKNSNGCSSTPILGTTKAGSLAPVSEKELEEFVLRFFRNLPSVRIVCISCIGGADGNLLRELLSFTSSAQAWILISRLNSDGHPVSVLLPAHLISKASRGEMRSSFQQESVGRKWHCPWVFSVVDDVAPEFRLILEENYESSSVQLDENTKRSRLAWWSRRKELDDRLGDFLQDMEQSWLGPWKYLLTEEWPDFRDLDLLRKKILDELGYDGKIDACQSVAGDARCPSSREDCAFLVILNKGCYVHTPNECSEMLPNISSDVETQLSSLFKTLPETNELELDHVKIKPVILVLGYEVQMLPWESLPVLKTQEVYRMPSVYSISVTLDKCCQDQEQVLMSSAIFPRIDPLDSYYVLNPGGDLSSTQVEFEDWFKDQNFEGITGTAPTIEELIGALKNHDLFIYIGHGSGAQYIPGKKIEELDSCAATVLMGCSSGSLSVNGLYAPKGAPLCYLLAGSPVIVANLWEVTDRDIDRFGKAMLDAWLGERSRVSKDSAECDVITDELKALKIGTRGNRKKQKSKKKTSESVDISTHSDSTKYRPKIGAFMGQARQACKLPYLIGAAPICYGVPTGITKKKEQ